MIALLTTALLLAPLSERPRDPWVFRCVLDGRPRSVVVALHADLWVAYDATNASLAKAWRGDVQLQGAVYDSVHGPQPVSRGPAYCTGLDGPVWFAEVEGELLELEPRWLGHAFVGEGVELRFEARLPSGGSVRVTEVPERVVSEDFHQRRLGIPAGRTGLMRTWSLAAPEGVNVLLRDGRASKHLLTQNVLGMRADPDRGDSLIQLDPQQQTVLTYFFDAPREAPPEDPEGDHDR